MRGLGACRGCAELGGLGGGVSKGGVGGNQ